MLRGGEEDLIESLAFVWKDAVSRQENELKFNWPDVNEKMFKSIYDSNVTGDLQTKIEVTYHRLVVRTRLDSPETRALLNHILMKNVLRAITFRQSDVSCIVESAHWIPKFIFEFTLQPTPSVRIFTHFCSARLFSWVFYDITAPA